MSAIARLPPAPARNLRTGGKPGPTDTVPAAITDRLPAAQSRAVALPKPGDRPVALTPGEIVLSKQPKNNAPADHMQAMAEEFERTGKVEGIPAAKLPRGLLMTLQALLAAGDEQGDPNEAAEGFACGGKVGFARGGEVPDLNDINSRVSEYRNAVAPGAGASLPTPPQTAWTQPKPAWADTHVTAANTQSAAPAMPELGQAMSRLLAASDKPSNESPAPLAYRAGQAVRENIPTGAGLSFAARGLRDAATDTAGNFAAGFSGQPTAKPSNAPAPTPMALPNGAVSKAVTTAMPAALPAAPGGMALEGEYIPKDQPQTKPSAPGSVPPTIQLSNPASAAALVNKNGTGMFGGVDPARTYGQGLEAAKAGLANPNVYNSPTGGYASGQIGHGGTVSVIGSDGRAPSALPTANGANAPGSYLPPGTRTNVYGQIVDPNRPQAPSQYAVERAEWNKKVGDKESRAASQSAYDALMAKQKVADAYDLQVGKSVADMAGHQMDDATKRQEIAATQNLSLATMGANAAHQQQQAQLARETLAETARHNAAQDALGNAKLNDDTYKPFTDGMGSTQVLNTNTGQVIRSDADLLKDAESQVPKTGLFGSEAERQQQVQQLYQTMRAQQSAAKRLPKAGQGSTQKPTWDIFKTKAMAANPHYSEQEIKAIYEQKYGR